MAGEAPFAYLVIDDRVQSTSRPSGLAAVPVIRVVGKR